MTRRTVLAPVLAALALTGCAGTLTGRTVLAPVTSPDAVQVERIELERAPVSGPDLDVATLMRLVAVLLEERAERPEPRTDPVVWAAAPPVPEPEPRAWLNPGGDAYHTSAACVYVTGEAYSVSRTRAERERRNLPHVRSEGRTMRRILAALAATAMFYGCELLSITNTNHQEQGQGQRSGGSSGGGDEDDVLVDLACARVETDGEASSCTLSWSGPAGPHEATATRSDDGLVWPLGAVTQGSVVDPGPAGAGGGTWTIDVASASTVVVLDT